MRSVSTEFNTAALADIRRPVAKLEVLWTDPFVTQGTSASTTDCHSISWHDPHLIDTIKSTPHKYLVLDGTGILDGTFYVAPGTVEQAVENQMGWYSSSAADADGDFATPPEVTVSFLTSRPIRQISVIGEPTIGQYPAVFKVYIYDENSNQLNTETDYTATEPETIIDFTDDQINDARSMKLVIIKWSHGDTISKIVEFFGVIGDTFYSNDIVSIDILEEREVGSGTVPTGNISSNEINIELQNIELTRENGEVVKDPYFPFNPDSYLKDTLTPNVRITPYLGFKLPDVFEAASSLIITEPIIYFIPPHVTTLSRLIVYYGEKVSDPVASVVDEVGIDVSISSVVYFPTKCILSLVKNSGISGTCSIQIEGKKYVSSPIEYAKMGVFWSNDWNAEETDFKVAASGRDRLELLRLVEFRSDEILSNVTLKEYAEFVLQQAKQRIPMADLRWNIDNSLSGYTVDYAYLGKVSYMEAVAKIAEACIGHAWMDRDDVLQIASYTANAAPESPDYEITRNDYFKRSQPSNSDGMKNSIIVPISQTSIETEINDIMNVDVTFEVGETSKIITFEFGNDTVTEPTIEPINESGVVTYVSSSSFTVWGGSATVTKTSGTSGTLQLKIRGKRLLVNVIDPEPIEDATSIQLYGKRQHKVNANPLIQNAEIAATIGGILLETYKNSRRDVNLEWVGNPAAEIGDCAKIPVYTPNSTGVSITDLFRVYRQQFKFDGSLRCSASARKAGVGD